MSYDEFNDSPFDLDHDGNIDPSEASYIEDTIYGDDSDTMEADEDAGFGGYVVSRKSVHEEHREQDDIKTKGRDEESLGDFIAALVVVVIIVAIMAFVGLALS